MCEADCGGGGGPCPCGNGPDEGGGGGGGTCDPAPGGSGWPELIAAGGGKPRYEPDMSWLGGLRDLGRDDGFLCTESWYINGGEGREVLGGVGRSWIDL